MRVLRIKKPKMIPKLVIGCLGLVSLGILIGGFATGNVFLIGGAAAGFILLCGAILGVKRNTQVTLV